MNVHRSDQTTPGYEVDITRVNEYQGRLPRRKVAQQATLGIVIVVAAVSTIPLFIIGAASPWSYALPMGVAILGGSAFAFWFRAYRKSDPSRAVSAQMSESQPTRDEVLACRPPSRSDDRRA